MKKYFEIFGFIILSIFSFYYTNKTVSVVKNTDDIMIKIRESENKKLPIDAYIEGNYVIPGLSGSEIDVSKSYDNMKKVGSYIPNLLVYKKIKPNKSIENIYDKYINKGNSNKKEVSLILPYNKTYLSIVEDNDIKANFLVDNTDNLKFIIDRGHVLIANNVFNIFSLTSYDGKYCYLEEEDIDILNICSMNKMHVVIPSKYSKVVDIKKNISNGSIIYFDNKNELDYMIKYVKSKGYDIVTLSKLLEE